MQWPRLLKELKRNEVYAIIKARSTPVLSVKQNFVAPRRSPFKHIAHSMLCLEVSKRGSFT